MQARKRYKGKGMRQDNIRAIFSRIDTLCGKIQATSDVDQKEGMISDFMAEFDRSDALDPVNHYFSQESEKFAAPLWQQQDALLNDLQKNYAQAVVIAETKGVDGDNDVERARTLVSFYITTYEYAALERLCTNAS